MMKEFLKMYFKVIVIMAIPIAFVGLISAMLCDILWYGGFIGYSNTIYTAIVVACGILNGIMVGIAGFNIVTKKWSFKIGAK